MRVQQQTPNSTEQQGQTLLTCLRALRAAEFSSPRAEDLERSKAIIFAQDGHGDHKAAQQRSAGAMIVPDAFGQTAMHYLAALRSIGACGERMLRALCASHPDEVDRKDNESDTALHEACRTGNLRAVRVLLEASASCAAKGLDGRSPLLMAGLWLQSARGPAMVNSSSEIVSLLTRHSILQGVSFDERDKYGVSINELIQRAPNSVGASVRKGIVPVRAWVGEASGALVAHSKVPEPLLRLVHEFVFGRSLASMLLERSEEEGSAKDKENSGDVVALEIN